MLGMIVDGVRAPVPRMARNNRTRVSSLATNFSKLKDWRRVVTCYERMSKGHPFSNCACCYRQYYRGKSVVFSAKDAG